MEKGIAPTPTISKNLSSSALAPLAQSKLRLGTADFRRECFWRNSKPLGISWRKPMPRGEAPRQLLRQINFGGGGWVRTSGTFRACRLSPDNSFSTVRRGRDSNSRCPFGHAAFPSRCTKPLCDTSAPEKIELSRILDFYQNPIL